MAPTSWQRLYVNNLGNIWGAPNPVTKAGATSTTISWRTAPANMPTIAATSGKYVSVTLNPNTATEEVVWVIEYAAAATTAKILPGMTTTTKRAHTSVGWCHSPTKHDFFTWKPKTTSGSMTLPPGNYLVLIGGGGGGGAGGAGSWSNSGPPVRCGAGGGAGAGGALEFGMLSLAETTTVSWTVGAGGTGGAGGVASDLGPDTFPGRAGGTGGTTTVSAGSWSLSAAGGKGGAGGGTGNNDPTGTSRGGRNLYTSDGATSPWATVAGAGGNGGRTPTASTTRAPGIAGATSPPASCGFARGGGGGASGKSKTGVGGGAPGSGGIGGSTWESSSTGGSAANAPAGNSIGGDGGGGAGGTRTGSVTGNGGHGGNGSSGFVLIVGA